MLKAKEDFGKARDIRRPFYTAGGVNMVSTVSIFEMNLIINCEHKDPHTILGMHEVFHDDREVVAVRAFLPGAKELSVIDKNDQEKVYKAERIHDDGFFEAVIDDRNEWF